MTSKPQTIKILILSANPRGTSKLRLDEEMREIKEGLRRSKKREQFSIESAEAVRYRDIHRAILDDEPNIVHFSGHGAGEEGLMFEDETGQVKLVEAEALAGLFELFADQVKCIVLNACYSKVQAEKIAQYIPYVIGMSQDIGDRAAIEFAVGFYDALGAGRTVEFAYKLGCNAIRLAGIAEHLIPALVQKSKLNKTRPSSTLVNMLGTSPGSVNKEIEVFFSYSHRDEELRDELAKHLQLLQRQGVISTWYDRNIGAGSDWAGAIDAHLNSAQIILLLISPDFMASDYCFDLEMKRAMERYQAGEAVVIPIILRPVDWTGALFSKLQGLPKNVQPVTTWSNRDEAFLDIAQGIRQTVEKITMSSSSHKSEPLVELEQSPLTSIQRLHLEQQLKEQQQEYDYRNQEIEFLSNSEKIDDLRPQERWRLTQQIAEAKQKRERAAKRMEELEQKLNL